MSINTGRYIRKCAMTHTDSGSQVNSAKLALINDDTHSRLPHIGLTTALTTSGAVSGGKRKKQHRCVCWQTKDTQAGNVRKAIRGMNTTAFHLVDTNKEKQFAKSSPISSPVKGGGTDAVIKRVARRISGTPAWNGPEARGSQCVCATWCRCPLVLRAGGRGLAGRRVGSHGPLMISHLALRPDGTGPCGTKQDSIGRPVIYTACSTEHQIRTAGTGAGPVIGEEPSAWGLRWPVRLLRQAN